MKKTLAILVILLLASFVMIMAKSANTIIEESAGTIPTLDPAWSYDAASAEAIWQLYDNLIQYNGISLTRFLPMLSTNVPNVNKGTILNHGMTYVFHIRKNVRFHNGDILTPEDVVYSLERTIIFDRDGGPSWTLAEPLLPKINGSYVDSLTTWAAKLGGVNSYSDLFKSGTKTPKNAKARQALINAFDLLAKDFSVKNDEVIIQLPHPYPPFLFILAHGASWTSIMDKKWAVSHGAWPGTADTWWKYHNPTREGDPLYDITNGTGPFVLERWIKGREIVFKRFDKYWAGPAKIEYGIIKRVNEFTTRKLDLLRGNADVIYVPMQYLSQFKNVKGVKIITGLPQLSIDSIGFTWNINSKGNRYIGSGKLDGKGIPPNFFANKDVRIGFEYLFPHKKFIDQVWLGRTITPNGCIPKGMLGYNPKIPPTYHQNLSKAAFYFKKAYGGKLWKNGFTFTAVYNSGNSQRQMALEMLKYYAKKLNPKFNINIVGELWASYLDSQVSGKLPLSILNWYADYPDPYDFAQPFYSSTGTFGSTLGASYVEWAKKVMDPLLAKSMSTTNSQKRAKLYTEMNSIAQSNAIYLWLDQLPFYEVQSSRLQGGDYNPMCPGIDFYSLSLSTK